MIDLDILENMTEDQISFIFDIARYYMNKSNSDSKTVGDVVDSMNEEQKNVLYYLVGKAIQNNAVDTSKTMMLPLDADDIPIAIGDVVYDIHSGDRLVVIGVSHGGVSSSERWYPADRLTHKKPDSYEDIIKEAIKEGFEQAHWQSRSKDYYNTVEKLTHRCEKVQERNKNRLVY